MSRRSWSVLKHSANYANVRTYTDCRIVYSTIQRSGIHKYRCHTNINRRSTFPDDYSYRSDVFHILCDFLQTRDFSRRLSRRNRIIVKPNLHGAFSPQCSIHLDAQSPHDDHPDESPTQSAHNLSGPTRADVKVRITRTDDGPLL